MATHHANCERSYRNATCRRAPRRGIALIIVLVTASVSMLLFGLWAQNMVREQRRFASYLYRVQATRLAEAGIHRAMARRAADPQFTEETWAVSADLLGGAHAATVQLRIVPTEDATALRFEATAQFPADAVRRAQVTKQMEVSNPTPEDES